MELHDWIRVVDRSETSPWFVRIRVAFGPASDATLRSLSSPSTRDFYPVLQPLFISKVVILIQAM